MPLPSRPRLILPTAAAAFVGGVLLASGLQWTPDSSAATFFQTAPAPPRGDVRPVAELSDAFISIAESVTPAVVSIHTERAPRQRAGSSRRVPEGMRDAFPFLMPEGHPQVQVPDVVNGSGFVISDQGYIVTNNHVVADAVRISVVLQDNRQLDATLVGRDPNTDIAVIKVEADDLPAVRIGQSESTRIGEWVLAIGNPLDLGITVTSGIVSAKGRALDNILAQNNGGSPWSIEDFIQTDAPINPGNSGGPLVNLRGEVVGVNTAIASPTGLYAGYGFAVPIDLARRVADDLIRYGRVKRPALGVQVTPVTPEDAEAFGLPSIRGVVAQGFPDESPAREAGLRQGDVIVAIEGREVERVGQFQRLVASRRPGEEVQVDVIRYGDRKRFRVRLMEATLGRVAAAEPGPDQPAASGGEDRGRLGISLAPVTQDAARELRFGDTRGLLVTEVVPFSPAFRYGIRKNMRVLSVDGQAVNDEAQFRRALERKDPGQVATFVLGMGEGQQSIVNVRLPRE